MMALVLIGDCAFDRLHIDRESARVDVHKHGRGAGIVNRRYGRHKGKGNGNHLIAGANSGREQGKVQSAGSGVHANPVLGLTIGGEFLLKRCHFASQGKLAGFQYALNGGVNFILNSQCTEL